VVTSIINYREREERDDLSVLLICGAHDRQSSHFECQAHGLVGCFVRTFFDVPTSVHQSMLE